MTIALQGHEIARQITGRFPDALTEVGETAVVVKSGSLLQVADFLRVTPGLEFDYLSWLAAVDYMDYFEVVYYLVSIKHNHSLVLKTRCVGRETPTVPSVVGLWRSADFQEREAYDLMGITFSGHPNLKRIAMWEGFEGHPLRRDFL